MIETSQLHTLVAVAKSRSFSKAAEELNVTQSAISQSIKNLETRIDVKLFKRTGKKVVLTPE
jgi:DNA-binding transcriptional LysR family regulator